MTEHEAVRELLALAAASALNAGEQRRVEDHARACPACARQLEAWRALSGALRRLPTPVVPAELVARTCTRVLAESAAAAERRWDDAVLVFLSLFAWTVGVATWAIVRLMNNGLLAVLDARFMQPMVWLTASSVLAWLTAGVVAVLVGHRRRMTWRSL